MQKLISRVCCLFLVVLVLAACLPFSAFAVDPVSAGVMANAFAQAIAAYGASNGVALTFDVANTDGIGESVHELWKDFREGTQSADDYATLAAALFPDLYYKASSVVAGAADVYTVGYNISSTYAEQFDNFYNWLLSGPAEMTKVDNQYYQFSQAQIGPESTPVNVISFNPSALASAPVVNPSASWETKFNSGLLVYHFVQSWTNSYCSVSIGSSSASAYPVLVDYVSGTYRYYNVYLISSAVPYPSYRVTKETKNNISYSGSTYSSNAQLDSSSNLYYLNVYSLSAPVSDSQPEFYLDRYTSLSSALSSVSSYIADPNANTSSVGVKAYGNTGIADIPDPTDPNYDAVAKQIPSTYPWNDSVYGDGTGALTDAQAGAIAGSVDDAIAVDGVVDLAGTREGTDEPGTDDPPSDDPDDYVVPGLADIFPFCIPFDIYNFLSALAAAPVAPHFTATLDFPEAVGGSQTIDIDFDSPTWNQLAQLLRLLELLAFIIGLALLTRSMFIRG